MAFLLLRPLEPCPGCRAPKQLRPLHVYANDTRQVNSAPALALVGCDRCGLVFSHPLPTQAELDTFYSAPDGWEMRVRPDKIESKLAAKRARYRQAVALLALQPGRALDFGCGLGAWLDVLQDDGWDTYGIEPGPAKRAIAGQRHHMLDDVPGGEMFDLAVVNHVLEHLRDPLSAVERLAGCVRPGGWAFVSVPDFGGLAEHRQWGYVKSERHICSYTFAALRSILGLAGFGQVVHLAGPEWEALGRSERWQLKVLAERTEPVEPSGRPLAQAVDALFAYEPEADRRALREEQLLRIAGSIRQRVSGIVNLVGSRRAR